MLKGSYREKKERAKRKKYYKRHIKEFVVLFFSFVVGGFVLYSFYFVGTYKKSEYEIMDEALKSYEQERLLRDKGAR